MSNDLTSLINALRKACELPAADWALFAIEEDGSVPGHDGLKLLPDETLEQGYERVYDRPFTQYRHGMLVIDSRSGEDAVAESAAPIAEMAPPSAAAPIADKQLSTRGADTPTDSGAMQRPGLPRVRESDADPPWTAAEWAAQAQRDRRREADAGDPWWYES